MVRSSRLSETLERAVIVLHKELDNVRDAEADTQGKRVGSVDMNDTLATPVEPGRHTLRIRSGRKSSRTTTFDAAEGAIVAFRCTGKSFLPIFLASFVVPSLALTLVRDY
jgi:hypothetical protein